MSIKGGMMSEIKTVAKPFEKLLNVFQGITTIVGALFVVAMSLLMLFMVVARYFFDYNWVWGQVVLTGMLAWGVFLIIGSVARKQQHISIGFFARVLFKDRAPLVMHTAENIVGLPFCIYMAWHSWAWVDRTRDLGLIEFVGTHTYDLWILRMVLPMGFIIASLYYFERCVKQLHQFYVRLSQNQGSTPSDMENQRGDISHNDG